MWQQYILMTDKPISKSIRKVFEPTKLRPCYLGKVKGSTTKIFMVSDSLTDNSNINKFRELEPDVKIITYDEYIQQKYGES